MAWANVSELAENVALGKITAQSLVEKSLRKIKEGKDYNAILETNPEALNRAKEIDTQVKSGKAKGRLLGVPFIAKDNFLTFNTKTTAGSKMLENFRAPYQATAIEKLEAEGAVLVAKANLDAFAHGSSTENSDFGPTKNPHNLEYVPGGSSGGSAAAVALGMAPFALGTDTGGSIRLPASFCGVVGLKPTYGLVSRYGVVAMASSTDVVGPITTSTVDAALVLDVLCGQDSMDATTIERSAENYEVDKRFNLKGLKIGIIKEHLKQGVSQESRKTVEKASEILRKAGAQIKEVSLPTQDLALAVYYIIVPAEISSNLARYDGVKYGHSASLAKDLQELYEVSRATGFNAENKRRIMMGTYVLSSGYYDAYYKKAQAVRTLLIEDYNKVFKEVDLLLGPTAPGTAFKIGAKSNPLEMYLNDIMTVSSNLTGTPAISIPGGQANGLPLGLQLQAPQLQEHLLLNAANALELLGVGK
ncbi:MAG: Asp-tRNA(Asn)/Glu-tRNA(Gln) amidotransferase subunit GatA [Candidatus Saccharimonadales bacterium]